MRIKLAIRTDWIWTKVSLGLGIGWPDGPPGMQRFDLYLNILNAHMQFNFYLINQEKFYAFLKKQRAAEIKLREDVNEALSEALNNITKGIDNDTKTGRDEVASKQSDSSFPEREVRERNQDNS